MSERPRKPSSTRRPSESRGFLSRKLSKKDQPSAQPGLSRSASDDAPSLARSISQQMEEDVGGKGKGREGVPPQEQEHSSRPVFKSVIPDQLTELPAWYSDAEWTSASAAQFRTKYPIHNRLGPRFYRNHHLAPRSLDRRPPSVFSPSFPPMAASTERLPDPARVAGPSRTPSGSPLPTPTSSQVRIHDVRIRTRKLSQGTHDGVDLLDGTDPWGNNWHHQSPYDLGANPDRSSPEVPEPSPTVPRPRRMSMTSAPRHKTVAPSPLSQSTSAVHLASTEPLSTRIPRRLSKTRKSFRGLFGSDHSKSPYMSRAGTAPVTPAEFGHTLGRKTSKMSAFIPASLSSSSGSLAPAEKKAKRGSMLGRLAKRFSVVKRSDSTRDSPDSAPSVRTSMHLTSTTHENSQAGERRSASPPKPPVRRSRTAEPPRRRVPAAVVDDPSPNPVNGPAHREVDSQSVMSVAEPFSMGRLTVTNPDEPSSGAETPPQIEQSSSASTMDQANNDNNRVLNEVLRSSPTPLDTPPFIHRGLSVISEGETYLSSPKAPHMPTPHVSPMTPPTIPSVLSLPLRSTTALVEPPAPPFSPPLPELPPAAKAEPPLPPTPESTRPPTPVEPEQPRHTSPTPAPASMQQVPSYMTSPSLASIRRSSSGYDNSPLSRASMIVNPPTPQTYPLSALPSVSSVHPPSPAPARAPVPAPIHAPAVAPASPRVAPASPRVPAPSSPAIVPAPVSVPVAPAAQSPSSPAATAAYQDQPSHENTPSRDSSPTKKERDGNHRTKSRRTETFKLVRSSEGDAGAMGGSFVVDGAHWAVVESPVDDSPTKSRKEKERERTSESDQSRRDKEKEKERTSGSDQSRKRESKKAESTSDDSDPPRRHEQHRKSVSRRYHSERETSPPVDPPPVARTLAPEAPTSRAVPERRRSGRESQVDTARSTRTPVIYAPSQPKPTMVNGSSGSRPERQSSSATRPSSELHSVAELNTLKAKDAWEIERLWKGRSMIYGPEGASQPTARNIHSDSRPSTIVSADLHRASTIPSVGDQSSTVTSAGSSHTYFVVQAPVNGVSSPLSSEAQALYPSYAQPVQQPSTRQDRRSAVRSLDRVPFPSSNISEAASPRSNPLPDPPRFSSYKPSPLPPSLAGGDGAINNEYWTKIAGVAVTH